MSTILYILLAILIFGILIAVHEWGHFIAARLCGVRVLEFSLGMGPLLWKKESKKGTLLSLRALPVGGFCAMEGEDTASDDPAAFGNAAPWKRFVILVAGAAMNFLFGLLVVILCFAPVNSFMAPTVTGFMEGCPYEGEYGLQEGDTFRRINGERIYFSSDVSMYMARGGEDGLVDIVLLRDGKRVVLEDYPMTLREYVNAETGETELKYGLYFGVQETGLWASLKYSWYCAMDFVRMVRLGLTDLITGAVGMDQMAGVVGIVDLMADVGTQSPTVRDGLWNIAYLAAFIAVNLAVMNLLPLPALDGGRIFFLLVNTAIERLFRRKVDPKYEAYINTAGLALLMGLMVYVMFNDIVRIVAG